MRLLFITICSISAILLTLPVSAQIELNPEKGTTPSQACADIISDCSTKEGVRHDNCLFASSKNPMCEGTTLGKLAARRWALGGAHDSISGPAFIGSGAQVDKECLTKWDTELFGQLINKEITTESWLPRLEERLNECKPKQESGVELPRP